MKNLMVWIVMIISVFIAIRSISFGVWTWRRKNRLGAAMIFLVAMFSVAFPAFALLFKG